MKTTREKADEFILSLLPKNHDFKDFLHAKKSAILSVEHTIEILKNVIAHDKERYGITCRGATIELDEQTELLTELESRL